MIAKNYLNQFIFMEDRIEFLKKEYEKAAIPLTEEQAEKFLRFSDLLIEKNRVMNLTAITEYQDIVVKHFIDSNMLWSKEFGIEKIAPELAIRSLIDVGTGAGFPGIPLTILRPEISVTLLDALQKRIGFLEEVKENLSLYNITCIHMRSEDGGHEKNLREQFDLAVARAVANLSVLAEETLPYVKVGGFFVAYKSDNYEDELSEAKKAISVLGGKTEKVISYTLPGSDIRRSLIYIRKEKETPMRFPRKAGKIEKDPIR